MSPVRGDGITGARGERSRTMSNTPIRKPRQHFTVLFIALFSSGTAIACEAPEFPPQIQQGALVEGCVPIKSRLWLDDREISVDPDGRVVFGIGRDQASPLQLRWRDAGGSDNALSIPVKSRDWKIERIDGLPQQTVTPNPTIAARIAREQGEVAASRREDRRDSAWRAGFLRPAEGRISGVYGSQRILNGTPKNPHYGMDIAVPAGTPIKAPAGGMVSFADPDLYLTGGTVLIDHGHGLNSSFLHMSRLDVKTGDRVEQGQVIGAVGATGRATGPHLHWGFNWFDVRLDPALLPVPMPKKVTEQKN